MNMVFDYIRYILLASSVLITSIADRSAPVTPVNAPDSTSVTLLFAGDIMQHGPQIAAAWNAEDSVYDYTPCFRYVRAIVSQYDFAIANLETTLGGEPYTGYPQFSAPDAIAVAAREAGFDIISTANNHSCDRGNPGIRRTIKVLDSLDLMRTGTYTDSADMASHHPLILRKNGITIALLNYTYGTNGLPFHSPVVVSLIDSLRIIADLNSLNNKEIDFRIVFFHWGNEYQSFASESQRKLALLCRENGADAVIGSHPHVLQPMEYYQPDSLRASGHLLVYSLGNFVSNQRDRFKDGGAMIGFNLSKTWNRKRVHLPEVHLTWVHTPIENGKKQYYILPVKQFENDTSIDKQALDQLRIFANDSRELLNKQQKAVPEAD